MKPINDPNTGEEIFYVPDSDGAIIEVRSYPTYHPTLWERFKDLIYAIHTVLKTSKRD